MSWEWYMTEHHQGRFHDLHMQTAPLKRRVLQYLKIKNFLRSLDHKEELLLVFSVKPFKIDQNKNQNRSIDKVQHLWRERRYIYKDPHQDSGQRNISYTRYPKNSFTRLIEICMEMPCWCSPGWAPTWRTETNRNICYRVLLQKREFILRETHKH